MQMKLRACSFSQHLWELVLVNEETRAHTRVERRRLERQQPQARELRTHSRHVRLSGSAEIYDANSVSVNSWRAKFKLIEMQGDETNSWRDMYNIIIFINHQLTRVAQAVCAKRLVYVQAE